MNYLNWGAASDCGRVRSVNEDSYLASPPVFVIADGMGGHAAGDVASRIAVDAFKQFVSRSAVAVSDALAGVEGANASILASAGANGAMSGMGTTVTGLVRVMAAGADHWLVFNVGDSRVYRLSGGHLEQLTIDHSEAEELVAEGKITREQARTYKRKNVVTRSLGTRPAPVADSWIFPCGIQERFIVCSDGLTNEVSDSEIEACAGSVRDPQSLAKELVSLAVVAGGRDNVTVIVVDSSEDPDDCGVEENTAPRGILPEEG